VGIKVEKSNNDGRREQKACRAATTKKAEEGEKPAEVVSKPGEEEVVEEKETQSRNETLTPVFESGSTPTNEELSEVSAEDQFRLRSLCTELLEIKHYQGAHSPEYHLKFYGLIKESNQTSLNHPKVDSAMTVLINRVSAKDADYRKMSNDARGKVPVQIINRLIGTKSMSLEVRSALEEHMTYLEAVTADQEATAARSWRPPSTTPPVVEKMVPTNPATQDDEVESQPEARTPRAEDAEHPTAAPTPSSELTQEQKQQLDDEFNSNPKALKGLGALQRKMKRDDEEPQPELGTPRPEEAPQPQVGDEEEERWLRLA